MAYNNYSSRNQNGYGQSRSNGGRSRSDGYNNYNDYNSQSRQPMEAEALPEDFVDKAEDVFRKYKDIDGIQTIVIKNIKGVTTTKLRSIYSIISDVYNMESQRIGEVTLDSASVAKLQMMRIRIIYEVGRDKKKDGSDGAIGVFIKESHLLSYLKDVGDKRAKAINLFHYLEALVAYHRFYGGKSE